jgi:hypothetical protein
MKKILLCSVLVTFAAWAAGCSSESDVRSDAGPSTTATEVTEPANPDDGVADTTTTEAPTGPKDSPYLLLQGSVTVPPGEPDALSVVFTGVPRGDMGSTVPVIVRNNTDDAVGDLEVNGTARGADGALAGSGSSQGFEPSIIQPGEWAFGYVYFDSTVPADATIEATARGDNPSESNPFGKIQLNVNEVNFQPGEFGSASYIGIVANTDSDETATDPVNVFVGCFDAESNLLDVFSGYTDGEVVQGGTASFSVDVYEAPSCASVAVGASGYSF